MCSAPVVSFVGENNAATTTGWSVTVSGIDFGSLDTTPTTRLGVSNCLTAAWASSTSLVCFTTPGEGVEKDAAMTVAGVVGTRTKTFSYDGGGRRELCSCGCLQAAVIRNAGRDCNGPTALSVLHCL